MGMSLVLGRFQPPHLGHLALLKAAASGGDDVMVCIGSAQRSHQPTDPFTAGERVEMVHAMAQEAGLPVRHIIPIEDIGRYPLWVEHVKSRVPRFDRVVTGSPVTAHLFAEAGIPVQRIDLVDRALWSATHIRSRLLAGQPVVDLVPPSVAKLLARPEVAQRLDVIRTMNETLEG